MRRTPVVVLRCLAVISALTVSAFAQEAAPVLRGVWTATGPRQAFQGTWSAVISAETPDAAQGSWLLLDKARKAVLQGTWAAEKSARGWQGTWSARIVTDGRASRSFSGTWQAKIEDSGTKTLAEMLQRTPEDWITGTWRSGGLQGNWSLKGSPP